MCAAAVVVTACKGRQAVVFTILGGKAIFKLVARCVKNLRTVNPVGVKANLAPNAPEWVSLNYERSAFCHKLKQIVLIHLIHIGMR